MNISNTTRGLFPNHTNRVYSNMSITSSSRYINLESVEYLVT
jgi:hypothetical protein